MGFGEFHFKEVLHASRTLVAGAVVTAAAVACNQRFEPMEPAGGSGPALGAPALVITAIPVDVTARGTLDPGVKIKTHPNRPIDVVSALVPLDGDGDGLVNDKAASDHVRWHTHPGPTMVIVTGGAGSGVTLYHAGSCEEHNYIPGDAFVAPDGIHAAWNESGADVVLRATFLIPVGAAPTVKEPATFTDCGLPAVE